MAGAVPEGLVEWLRLQLDADQQKIAAILRRSPNWRVDSEPWDAGGVGVLDDQGDAVAIAVGDYAAEHIANWDPSRVLREVEAKRKIIDEYENEIKRGPARPHVPESVARHEAICDAYRAALRILAAIFDQRPGYHESWRPT